MIDPAFASVALRIMTEGFIASPIGKGSSLSASEAKKVSCGAAQKKKNRWLLFCCLLIAAARRAERVNPESNATLIF